MMKVLIEGYGLTGQTLLDYLVRDEHILSSIETIFIISKHSTLDITPRLMMTSENACKKVSIKHVKFDINDIEGTAKLLSNISPHVIISTGMSSKTFQYETISMSNNIGYSPWIPMIFPHIYKLMKSVKMSGIDTKVITTCMPDGINALLGSVGLAPYCGVTGITSPVINMIKASASKLYRVKYEDISVDFVSSNYVNQSILLNGGSNCRSLLRLYHTPTRNLLMMDENMNPDSSKIDILLPLCKSSSMISGPTRYSSIAAECINLLRLLVTKCSGLIHVTGLNGSLGCCKCYAKKGELTINSHFDQHTIEEIGKLGLLYDGASIGEGVIQFTDKAIDDMKKCFNIDYPKFINVDNLEDFANSWMYF